MRSGIETQHRHTARDRHDDRANRRLYVSVWYCPPTTRLLTNDRDYQICLYHPRCCVDVITASRIWDERSPAGCTKPATPRIGRTSKSYALRRASAIRIRENELIADTTARVSRIGTDKFGKERQLA